MLLFIFYYTYACIKTPENVKKNVKSFMKFIKTTVTFTNMESMAHLAIFSFKTKKLF